jgi:hypothetical protein
MCCLLMWWQRRITPEGDAGKAWIVDSREGEQKVGRSLNAAKLRMQRTHIMCMQRQRCGVMSDSKGGTRRPKLASSSSVDWW